MDDCNGMNNFCKVSHCVRYILHEIKKRVYFLPRYSTFVRRATHFWSCVNTKLSHRNSNSFRHPLFTHRNKCQAKARFKNCLKLMQGNVSWNFSKVFQIFFLQNIFLSFLSLNLMPEILGRFLYQYCCTHCIKTYIDSNLEIHKLVPHGRMSVNCPNTPLYFYPN